MKHDSVNRDPHGAWDRGDLKQAFHLFSLQAAAGDDGAQLNLGYFYDCGLGTRRNRVKAMLWYRRAYRQGSSAAASNIATVYRDNGQPRQAFAWYKRAALMKDGDALVEMAKHYLSGSGVRRNGPEARRMLKRAIASTHITEAGREEAQVLLHVAQQTAARDRVKKRGA
jgi:uncharacterized protein